MLRCLVVDNDEDGARALGEYLGVLGADVRVAFSGAKQSGWGSNSAHGW